MLGFGPWAPEAGGWELSTPCPLWILNLADALWASS